MKTALARFAPALSVGLISSTLEPRSIYEDLILVPGVDQRPVRLNHDSGTETIGRIVEVFRSVDPTAFGIGHTYNWWHARIELDDNAPPWISRGTPVSISTHSGHVSEVNGWTCRRGAIVNELSILSPANKPREPLARLLLVQDKHARRAPPRRRTRAEAEMAELDRRIDQLGPHATGEQIEAVILGLKYELAA